MICVLNLVFLKLKMIMESPKILGMIISDQATGYELIHLLFISSTSNVRMKMCQ